MKVYVGVDCGATNLRVGIFSLEGEIIAASQTVSPLKDHPGHLAEVVHQQLDMLIPEKRFYPQALGVGTPGPIDLKHGWILPSSNIGNKEPIDVKDQFQSEFKAPLFLDRDTNLALLGEVWQGAGKGIQDVVMLTLGTGVGGAVMIDGKVEHGKSGKAGEIGHTFIEIENLKFKIKNLPRCGLGHKGCLEALINASENWQEMAKILGFGLANIVDIFNPQMIILGGGKLKYQIPDHKKRDFLTEAIDTMKKVGMKGAVDEVEVIYAKLDEMSGVYGGAKLAYDSIKN